MRSSPIWFLGAWLIAGAAAATLALNPPSSAQAEEEPYVTLAITAQDIRIEDFLIALAMVSGENIVFNPESTAIEGRTIRGGVNLRTPAAELMTAARSLLLAHGIAFQRTGPEDHPIWAAIEIDSIDARDNLTAEFIPMNNEFVEELAHDRVRFITTVMPVEHLQDLGATQKALAHLLSLRGRGSVSAVPEARALVVTDFAPHVLNIYRALKRLDVPSRGNTTTAGTTVALAFKHARAEDVAHVLVQHFAAPPAREDSPQPHGPRIVAHRASNQVLVTGTEAEVLQVRTAAALLDVPVPAVVDKAR